MLGFFLGPSYGQMKKSELLGEGAGLQSCPRGWGDSGENLALRHMFPCGPLPAFLSEHHASLAGWCGFHQLMDEQHSHWSWRAAVGHMALCSGFLK